MASSSEDTYKASDLAKWFHSALHKDFKFDDTTTIFKPSDESYNEALFLLAIFISSFGALIFILLILYQACYFTCKKTWVSPPEMYHKTKSCLQHSIFIFAIICGGAIVVGFIFNGKASDGVDQFKNSVDDIQSDLNGAYRADDRVVQSLVDARTIMEQLKDESGLPDASTAYYSSYLIFGYLHNINSHIPVDLLDRGGSFDQKVHRYDNYRWLVTVGIYTWSIFLCLFCFWSYCQTNCFSMFFLTILAFSTVLISWAVLGAHFSIATGIGDFCVHPATAIKEISHSNITSVLIDYYIKCSNYDPFKNNFILIQQIYSKVYSLIQDITGEYPTLANEILLDLDKFNNNLSLYRSQFDCSKIHKEYMDAMDGLCNKTLNGVALIIVTLLIVAFVSGLVTCCACPLWKYRKPYHLAHPNAGNARGDGNVVLLWPHGLGADPDGNPARRQDDCDDRTPLMPDQSPNYGTVNHSNLNYIQPNINVTIPNVYSPPRSNDTSNGARHSF